MLRPARKADEMICPECFKEFEPKDVWRRRIAKFCSKSCSASFHKRKYPIESGRYSRLYRCWRAMFGRHRPSHEAYERYKDKPICDEWHDYEIFMRWALANGYQDNLSLDRRENHLGYSPDNCRWATRSEQCRNRADNLPAIEALGDRKTLLEWVQYPRCKVDYRLLYKRIAAGWPIEIALQTPSQSGGKRPVGFNRSSGWRGWPVDSAHGYDKP